MLPARPGVLAAARQSIVELLQLAPAAPAPIIHDVQLALTEALTNAILHAYRERGDGRIELVTRSVNGTLVVSVRDFGTGMEPRVDSPGLGMGMRS